VNFFPTSSQEWAARLMGIIVMILSLSVHEWAHAFSAFKLGDDTAEREGRLTLNPLSHIDPFGTLLLPLLGVPLGWAKPVPFNPARFRRGVSMAWGTMITKIAGPASNLILAVGCAVGLGFLLRGQGRTGAEHEAVRALLVNGLMMNVGLAVFNMLPIHPLDGAGVLEPFIPRGLRDAWNSYLRVGPLLLMVVLVTGGVLLSAPIGLVQGVLVNLVRSIAA
jgi:Zn-dependent protease